MAPRAQQRSLAGCWLFPLSHITSTRVCGSGPPHLVPAMVARADGGLTAIASPDMLPIRKALLGPLTQVTLKKLSSKNLTYNLIRAFNSPFDTPVALAHCRPNPGTCSNVIC